MLKVIALTTIAPSSETAIALGARFALSHPDNSHTAAAIPINRSHILSEAHTRCRKRQSAPQTPSFFDMFFDIAKSPPSPHLHAVVTTVGGFGIFSLATMPPVESQFISRRVR